MLINIHVKNFALIEEADVDLKEGLNILTGETGAGKSILIDAVNAGLGGRLKSDVIGPFSDHAFVSLVFTVDKNKAALLNEMDIDTDYNTIIVTRKISADRSVYKINDENVTSAKVRAVTGILIDIHGQHEHQSLLSSGVQRDFLDHFAGLCDAVDEVCALNREMVLAANSLSAFSVSEEERLREMDFLRYEIAEIENADIKPNEKEDLLGEFSKINNSARLAADVGRALGSLAEAPENVSDLIDSAIRSIGGAAEIDSELASELKQLYDAAGIVNDAIHSLKSYSAGLSFDQKSLDDIEKRLDEINNIEHKYGGSYKAVNDSLCKRREKLLQLEDYENKKAKAQNDLKEARNRLDKAANELSEKRKKAAAPFEQLIVKTLASLNFLDIRFSINIENKGEYTEKGYDEVSYLISANPGEPLRPLSQVASGGELSRIMLGFKSVLADRDEIPTLIFDEIDSGISGKTALYVAQRLKEIARYHQVICITHLPQIAAAADEHFVIEKGVENMKTVTRIQKLSEKGELEELGRLLGSGTLSEAVYQNASEIKSYFKKQ